MPTLDFDQLPAASLRELNTEEVEDDAFGIDLTMPSLDIFELPSYNPLME
jgi:hypothetical protein